MQTLSLEPVTKNASKPTLKSEQFPAESASDRKPRLGWIDYARGISIIMVVVTHTAAGFRSIAFNGFELNIDYSLNSFLNNIFTSRMPLFFVVTGMFIRNSFEKRGFNAFIKYKFSTILYPFFIWVCLQILFQVIGNTFGGSATVWRPKDLLSIFLFPQNLYQFWFLYAMFEVVAVFAVLKYLLKLSSTQFLIGATLLFIGNYFIPNDFYALGVKYICKYLFYIALGDVIRVIFLNEKFQVQVSSLKSIVTCTMLFVLVRIAVNTLGFPNEEGQFISLQNLMVTMSTLTGMCLLFNISFVLDRFNLMGWLKIVGSHSLHILCMHLIVGGTLRHLLLRLSNYQYPSISYYAACLGAIMIPIFFNNILERLNLGYFFYPGRKPVRNIKVRQQQ